LPFDAAMPKKKQICVVSDDLYVLLNLSQTFELFSFSGSQGNLKTCSSVNGVKEDFVDNLPVLQTMETLFIIDVDKDLNMV